MLLPLVDVPSLSGLAQALTTVPKQTTVKGQTAEDFSILSRFQGTEPYTVLDLVAFFREHSSAIRYGAHVYMRCALEMIQELGRVHYPSLRGDWEPQMLCWHVQLSDAWLFPVECVQALTLEFSE